MNVIEVKNVHKSFKIHYDKGATLKEKILFKNRNRYEEHQVLKGIDLKIEKGEVVGLIGENGCGKSTLLKLMTRIIYPDQGTITVKGKVSSLLELGAGFHPDMSGRENIYTNASIFGLTKKEIDERLEDIIAFSELGEFIENPVRTYSSGMYMRLAFSVAINVDAEILLVDEILAVGDAAFQAKCFNKMQEIKRQGTTIVIVSHDLGSVEKLCDRAVWIKNGKKEIENGPRDVVYKYLDYIMNKEQGEVNTHTKSIEYIEENKNDKETISEEGQKEGRLGNRDIEITKVRLIDLNLKVEKNTFKPEEAMVIRVEYKRNNPKIEESVFGIAILNANGILCYGSNTYIDNGKKIAIQEEGIIETVISPIQLLEGKYVIEVAFHDEYAKSYDHIKNAGVFDIYSNIKDVGIIRLNHNWNIVE